MVALQNLLQQAGARPLALFRVLFGIAALACLAALWDNAGPLFHTPKFLFSYPGLAWLQPWPGAGLYWHLGVMAACAGAVTLGLFFRWASAVLFVGTAYLLLLDRTLYQDVLYLAAALAFIMVFLPAHACWSLDALRRGSRDVSVPVWSVLTAGVMLTALLLAAMVHVLGAIEPGAGPFGDQLRQAGAQPAVYALTFAGAGLLLLLAPLRGRAVQKAPPDLGRPVAPAALLLFAATNLLLPLGSLAANGNTGWLDAQRRPLTATECAAVFNVSDKGSPRRWNVSPTTRLNALQADRMSRQPELVGQFARHIAEHFAAPKYGFPEVAVMARIKCTQDGRRYGLVLDPDRDLLPLTKEQLLQARLPFRLDNPAQPAIHGL